MQEMKKKRKNRKKTEGSPSLPSAIAGVTFTDADLMVFVALLFSVRQRTRSDDCDSSGSARSRMAGRETRVETIAGTAMLNGRAFSPSV